jgi:hypothetical protein
MNADFMIKAAGLQLRWPLFCSIVKTKRARSNRAPEIFPRKSLPLA